MQAKKPATTRDHKTNTPVPERQLKELDASFEGFFRAVSRSMAPPPTDVELSPKAGRAMMFIAQVGRVTMTDLADRLGVALSSATRMVEGLIDKGLAMRTRVENDRRVVFIELSSEGQKLHQSFVDQRRTMGREMLAPLSAGEREIFLELMKKIAGQPTKE